MPRKIGLYWFILCRREHVSSGARVLGWCAACEPGKVGETARQGQFGMCEAEESVQERLQSTDELYKTSADLPGAQIAQARSWLASAATPPLRQAICIRRDRS